MDAIDPNLEAFLQTHPELNNVELIGGSSALGAGFETLLKTRYSQLTTLSRTEGANRFATNVALLRKYVSGPTVAVVANGEQSGLPGARESSLEARQASSADFFNALLAGPYSANQEAALLLTRTADLPSETRQYVLDNQATLARIIIFGDTSQVSAEVEATPEELLQN